MKKREGPSTAKLEEQLIIAMKEVSRLQEALEERRQAKIKNRREMLIAMQKDKTEGYLSEQMSFEVRYLKGRQQAEWQAEDLSRTQYLSNFHVGVTDKGWDIFTWASNLNDAQASFRNGIKYYDKNERTISIRGDDRPTSETDLDRA